MKVSQVKMNPNEVDKATKADVLKILVATDCHLGFAEKDPVRGNDTYATFEEILSIARDRDVDAIILGGDLFHQNKPSRSCLHKCLHLLRTYCMGDKPVEIEFLSDQSENFRHSPNPVVNYEDPNTNIAIPVFSIHGNHDDPAGSGNLCALDLLSVTGLINYFGKSTDLQTIQMSPLLMQKGQTKLALYGLGSICDERLHRLFRENKVTMIRPREDPDSWFNLFVIHQNRVKHGLTNYIPEQYLDDFLDLIIWGHEHECRIKPEWNPTQQFFVSQPGSSVATSLCPGEAVTKHVGFLQIYKKYFKMSCISLQTVRQFYIEDISLSETGLNPGDSDIANKVFEYCKERVENILDKAAVEHSGNSKQPRKPLIRLKVDYDESFEIFNVQRFGQQFVDKVANPKDIISFHRKKSEKLKGVNVDLDCLKSVLRPEILDNSRVEDLVKEYFQKAEQKSQMALLSENGLGTAVQVFVEKDVKEAIEDLVSHQIKKVQNHLYSMTDLKMHIEEEINKYKEERLNSQDAVKEVELILESSRKKASSAAAPIEEVVISDDEAELANTSTAPKHGRGTGRGRGRGRARAAPKKRESLSTSRRGRSSVVDKKEVRNSLMDGFKDTFSYKSKNVSDKAQKDHEFNNMQENGPKRRKFNFHGKQGIKFDSSEDSDNPF